MTVQFILPEATSFPKERKLHDRLFLVLLYNLLCKTFKDHSSAFAASALSERNSLLQERCFPIASAKVGHFCIPCKTSPKKNARKIHLHPFCYFIAWQNRQLSPFFRFIPSLSFSPQDRRFSPDPATFGAKTTFFGVSFSSAREKFSPKISVFAEKISLTRRFSAQITRISTFADVEKRKQAFFHLTTDGAISKRGRFCPNTSTRTKKHKAITKKPKDKIKKQTYYTEKTKHNRARQIVFLSLPHSVRKIQADFLSKRPHFSRLPPLFYL